MTHAGVHAGAPACTPACPAFLIVSVLLRKVNVDVDVRVQLDAAAVIYYLLMAINWTDVVTNSPPTLFAQ